MVGMHDVELSVVPEPLRICVCAAEPELRAWLLEELSLMTWPGALQLTTLARYAPADADLVIVGLEQLDAGELAQLRERRSITPLLLAIGTLPHGVWADRLLDPRTNSRELKQAIRELLVRR
jgi:hypothetical protein